jgi:hypothetical protein
MKKKLEPEKQIHSLILYGYRGGQSHVLKNSDGPL